jgi:hypothetical protein
MKKILFKMAFCVMIVTVVASCKKDDSLLNVSSFNEYKSESVYQNSESQYRQIPINHVLEELQEEYDCCFDFDNLIHVTPPSGVLAAHIFVAPSTWTDDFYLTIIINGSAQVIGLYQIEFTSGFKNANRDIESEAYGFKVYDQDYDVLLFSGDVYTNVPYYPDRVYIPGNHINLYYYTYPLFDNLSTGYTNLENYVISGVVETPGMTSSKMALKLASTFYVHFYLD